MLHPARFAAANLAPSPISVADETLPIQEQGNRRRTALVNLKADNP